MPGSNLNGVLEAVLALHAPLSGSEQRLSLALYRLLATGEPVRMEALAHAAQLELGRIDSVLSEWPGVYRDGQGRVIGYWGLTIAETPHRMLVGRKWLHTWCAWDTLFLPELLGSAARVESSCPVSGARIALVVAPEGVVCEGPRPLVSFVEPDLRKAAQDLVHSFCHYIHFFGTEQAAQDWAAAHPGTFLATLDEAWELGRRRNARCYPGSQFSFGVEESSLARG